MEFGLGWEWTPETYEKLLNVSGGEDRILYYANTIPVNVERRARLRHLAPVIHREKTRLFAELADEAGKLARPGVKRLIHEARATGCRIGVAVNSMAPNTQWIMQSALGENARNLIDAVASAAHVKRRKPAPDLYVLLLSMLGLAADRCVAIEDSANGVAAAKAAGLFTIAVPGRWTRAQNFSRADLVLPSLGDPESPPRLPTSKGRHT
jgi:HAD superfamily hydrolase (TIGR01509 family)